MSNSATRCVEVAFAKIGLFISTNSISINKEEHTGHATLMLAIHWVRTPVLTSPSDTYNDKNPWCGWQYKQHMRFERVKANLRRPHRAERFQCGWELLELYHNSAIRVPLGFWDSRMSPTKDLSSDSKGFMALRMMAMFISPWGFRRTLAGGSDRAALPEMVHRLERMRTGLEHQFRHQLIMKQSTREW